MRKWLAGWLGQFSAWFGRAANRIWPPYPRRFAVGGEVQGPGPASEDSIPVWLGEQLWKPQLSLRSTDKPERVLSPEETRTFEALLEAMSDDPEAYEE